jgi:serine/threonine protein kinase
MSYTLDLENQLGAGAAGSVYQGHLKRFLRQQKVAVKMFNLSSTSGRVSYQKESLAIQQLKHLDKRFFVRFYSVHRQNREGYIIMKLYNEDFANYLARRNALNALEESSLRSTFRSICKGLKILHDNKIAHLDLKPENIFMKGNKPFIGDFGTMFIQEKLNSLAPVSSFHGTLAYAPPEVRNHKHFDPFAADIYSLGVTLFYSLTGSLPNFNEPIESQLNNSAISLAAHDMIKSMMAPIPADRPTPQELLSFSWLLY